MNIQLEEETIRAIIVDDLKWHYESAGLPKKLRKAIRRTLAYYMTYEECKVYFGPKLTRELWNDE